MLPSRSSLSDLGKISEDLLENMLLNWSSFCLKSWLFGLKSLLFGLKSWLFGLKSPNFRFFFLTFRTKQNIVINFLKNGISSKTILLHRLQLQTLANATPPTGKTHAFSKIALTPEPVMRF